MLDFDQQIKRLKSEICKMPTGRGIVQFVVGEPSASTYYSRGENELGDLTLLEIPTDGQTQFTVNECCIVLDSASLFKDGVLISKGRTDRLTLEIQYTNKKLVVVLTPSFKNGSIYTLYYDYHK